MSDTEIRLGNRKFYDDRNYPRGFSRSGDFTISEAAIMEKYGVTCRALTNESITPESEAEHHFVAVFKGEVEATTPVEKIWKKYLSRTEQRHYFSVFGSKVNPAADDDDSYVDDDIEMAM